MRGKFWFSAAMLVIGVGLMVASASGAGGAAAGSTAEGGTLRVNLSGTDVDFVDPALGYFLPTWQIEYATCAKLFNYPDAGPPLGWQIRPEAATAFPRISKDGKTYTFTIRSDMKFSDGKTLGPANFAAAINRDLNPSMQSPAWKFVSDIVGAKNVVSGKARTASGVKVSGQKLVIELKDPAPDLTARLAMPFFCAIPTDLPINPNGVDSLPAAGPYYIKSRVPNQSIVLARNTFYRGPRPQGPDRIVYTVNTDLNQSFLQVKRGTKDYDAAGPPPIAAAQLGAQFGVNKSRFFSHPLLETDYVALNTSRPLFRSLSMRRAVNYAIDRPAMLRQRGAYAGKVTDHILPPDMPDFRAKHTYPLHGPDVAKAKRLVGGRPGTVQLYYLSSGVGPLQAQVLAANLKQIGLHVSLHAYTSDVLWARVGRRGEPFDAVITAWNADFADPGDFIDVLLNGKNVQAANNDNLAYLDNPGFNAKMDAAAKLSGTARYKRYGALDLDLTANAAPWAAFANRSTREFVSTHVKNFVFQPVYGGMDLAAAQLK
jgi:ABC-type transport system substrate-binding protein